MGFSFLKKQDDGRLSVRMNKSRDTIIYMFHHRLVKRFIWIFVSILIFVGIIAFFSTKTYKSEVILAGRVFEVDVVDTNYLLSKGLSGRMSLDEDQGMLFVFQKPDKYGFWMKDMLFPIDIIWFDQNFKIIHVEKSVSPQTYPKIFTPESNSLYVLEISAGQVQKLGIQIGDKTKFWKKSD
ncbi:MAG: hypothetical protein A3H52_02555 [Candidatus Zambryskibacteria bacterium RIFCSPLOWO2_02_FULL_39_26]|uniref:DUF192 domain-containing protein n=1 Tax=Candidatus Zambryskibacteria bacterium RIFCSPLOWO2_12_FULL_39_23 TaxID=1802776 RepID=A0A1G2UT10_9BACT|nr:MAG: hypothetical protein A3E59_00840 [Candidatus Zambryskibacteria bacterium RIFCSPHIGHO2_12_FULL_39_47]OHB09514.1 MAG: hypothetical protein A3H52_02555 [Candidatus Zambryskibacteria bacterium RIFCSPLOWO2_02_FULL_39_26]OHB12524.1 MAG: hypothetical protein A3G99_01740 [Candidatus Zambryskibacteria bacterium RIFCSPLOWO2_12_FULL_39_23]